MGGVAVRVGLRPARHANVRLEAESGTRLVHNYGHDGPLPHPIQASGAGLAQFALEDLAGGAEGQGGHEDHLARELVPADLVSGSCRGSSGERVVIAPELVIGLGGRRHG